MAEIIDLHPLEDREHRLSVLGEPLEECGCNPVTGWFRDGYCATDRDDAGHHVICSVMSEEFLEYSRGRGNDLSTPRPEFGFAGLQPGDHWCVCAQRWAEAFEAGKAPAAVLASTHRSALTVVSLEDLKSQCFAH